MYKQKKNQSGITLVALVISIIVMLILAGISLSATIGENGIITQAQKATFAQKIAKYKEEYETNVISVMSSDGIPNRSKVTVLNEHLRKYIPSFEDGDIGQFAILSGELYYMGDEELEREICFANGFKMKEEGIEIEDFIADVESDAVEEILKDMVADSFFENIETPEGNEEESSNRVGIKLYDKNFANGNRWKIITEVSDNNTVAIYGTGWYFVEAGNSLPEIGTLKNSYIINYDTGKAVKFSSKHTILNSGSNLSVMDGLVFNGDPTNMGDGSQESWGGAKLHGFNGTEYEADGKTVKSGWTPTALYFDGENDYLELETEALFTNNQVTFEVFGLVEDIKQVAGTKIATFFNKSHLVSTEGPCVPRFGMWDKGNSNLDYIFNFGQVDSGTPWSKNASYSAAWLAYPSNFKYNEKVFYSLTCDFNTGKIILYENGEEKSSEQITMAGYFDVCKENLNNKEIPFRMGIGYWTSWTEARYLHGQIYSCRIYNKVLTSSEIKANHNATVSYHNILINSQNGQTGGNTGGENIENIQ